MRSKLTRNQIDNFKKQIDVFKIHLHKNLDKMSYYQHRKKIWMTRWVTWLLKKKNLHPKSRAFKNRRKEKKKIDKKIDYIDSVMMYCLDQLNEICKHIWEIENKIDFDILGKKKCKNTPTSIPLKPWQQNQISMCASFCIIFSTKMRAIQHL